MIPLQKLLKQNLGFIVIFVTSLFVALWLYHHVLLPLGSIGWDEGRHLLDAASVAFPVHHGNLRTAVKLSFEEFFYPPGYSWLEIIWSFFSGISLTSFRLFSLSLWVGSALLVYQTAISLIRQIRLISSIEKPIIGGIASALFITAPINWIFGTEAMLEMTGAFFTLVTVWLLIWATDHDDQPARTTWRRWLAVGVSLTLLHSVKYNYAMWLLLAILADLLVATWTFGFKWLKANIAGPLIALSVLLLSFIVWVLLPGRVSDYLYFFQDPNFYSYELIPLWQHLVWYFPITVLSDYLASPWLVLLLLPGIYLVFKNSRNRSIRIIALAFLINFFFATLHLHNQQERYIFTTVPLLYILGAAGTIEGSKFLKHLKSFKLLIATGLVIAVVVVRDLIWDLDHVYGIAEHILSSPVYASADYHDTAFNFDKSQWPVGPRLKESPQDILFWVINNSDSNKPLSYFGRSDEISPPALEYLRLVSRETKSINLANSTNWRQYTLALEVSPSSIINTYDFQKMNQAGTEAGLNSISSDPTWQKLAEKEFVELGVKVSIWGQ